jgi:hypothetical protein
MASAREWTCWKGQEDKGHGTETKGEKQWDKKGHRKSKIGSLECEKLFIGSEDTSTTAATAIDSHDMLLCRILQTDCV